MSDTLLTRDTHVIRLHPADNVAIEAIEGIEENMQALANDAHCADA